MKKVNIVLLLVIFSTFTSFPIVPASSAPKKYVLELHATWNADMVNTELVNKTGDGVYIA